MSLVVQKINVHVRWFENAFDVSAHRIAFVTKAPKR